MTKLFLSWSGTRSRSLANGLRLFLPDVIQAAEPFVSMSDVASGVRWPQQLDVELKSTTFGIVCLTPENIDSRWVLYEAGALATHLENTRVCPCLLDLSPADVPLPLGQFQSERADKAGIWRIVVSANEFMESPLDDARLASAFARCWPELEILIAEIPLPDSEVAPPARSDREILNEMLSMLRAQIRVPLTGSQGMLADIVYSEIRELDLYFEDAIKLVASSGQTSQTTLASTAMMGAAMRFRSRLPRECDPWCFSAFRPVFNELESLCKLTHDSADVTAFLEAARGVVRSLDRLPYELFPDVG